MSLGFQKAGFNIVAGIDNWKSAIRVYGMNFNHPIIEQDLLDVDEAVKIIAAYAPDLIIGGPPCQDFSTAGYQDESRGRASLLFTNCQQGQAKIFCHGKCRNNSQYDIFP